MTTTITTTQSFSFSLWRCIHSCKSRVQQKHQTHWPNEGTTRYTIHYLEWGLLCIINGHDPGRTMNSRSSESNSDLPPGWKSIDLHQQPRMHVVNLSNCDSTTIVFVFFSSYIEIYPTGYSYLFMVIGFTVINLIIFNRRFRHSRNIAKVIVKFLIHMGCSFSA